VSRRLLSNSRTQWRAANTSAGAGIRRKIDAMHGMVRERLLSVAGKISVSCDIRPGGEVEATIRTEICEALDEILSFASTIIEHRGHQQ
jgi:hypothetical protein